MKETALHEILAVEAGLKKTSKDVMEEGRVTFSKKAEHFSGHLKTYECIVEGDLTEPEAGVTERQEIVTTVHDKLVYILKHVSAHVDCMATKDKTNQIAVADIVVDGATFAPDVPVTTLLSLEDTLKNLRAVVGEIPTLAPGKNWIPAPEQGDNIFKLEHPESKIRTRQMVRSQTVAEPTKEHAAQVNLYNENVTVGRYITERISGAITPAEKSVLLSRVDKLFRAVKQARQRANSAKVTNIKIFKPLADFIIGK